ncbi:RNA-binding protein MEX3A [Protopterus annectens]|uniref:RNA-binding protein MEX3A n=1 Tax=Protopterus annectens TaxID=7888 RepID=UPI001CFAC0A1|nr:RNA-binding protein MEX3A [Protopterus annectens]
MPSLVLSGIMERNRGLEDVGSGGFGKDGVLEDDRALQIALDQLCLLGLGEPGEECNNNSPKTENKFCAVYEGSELRLRSSNTTECVPVPSSEHVAEIVGRQGCKIKALRAKTNTYIKTPVRGEDPVFMVTGRREDVAMARREIISAAEHFSMIRASRNKSGTTFSNSAPNLPGQVTIRVRVPYRVVGLVVGPKGATIKRIQQQTSTYIITPSRDRDPVFEISGTPSNVERAREEIEAHIAIRTGKILDNTNENDLICSSPDSGGENRYPDIWRVQTLSPNCKPLSTFRQNSLGCVGNVTADSFYGTPRLSEQNELNYSYLFTNFGMNKHDLYFGVQDPVNPIWTNHEGNGVPVSGGFSSQQRSNSTGGVPSIPRTSPTSQESNTIGHSLARRAHSEPLQSFSKLGSTLPGGSPRIVPVSSNRECTVCFESEVTAALVPCGHNLFCMECAVRICEQNDPECPACHVSVTQAIRIFS